MQEKLLVISKAFPPDVGGSHTVLRNLFTCINIDSYIVVRGCSVKTETPEFEYEGITLDLPKQIRRVFPLYLILIPVIIFRLFLIHRKHKIGRCLIIFPDPFFSVAAYIFARLSRLPYVIYFHDLFEESYTKITRVIQRSLAKIFEHNMIHNAERFLVVSESLRIFYSQKYGMESTVIPHSIDPAIISSIRQETGKCSSGHIHIVYSGGVYGNQIDALQALIQVIKDRDDIRLTITSGESDEQLDSLGLKGRNVETRFFENREDVFQLQRESDLLYLPLSFESKIPLEIKTSVPTKFYEYLAAMRPIFIHAPEESYLYQFCEARKLGCTLCKSKSYQQILASILSRTKIDVNRDERMRLLRNHSRDDVAEMFKSIVLSDRGDI